MYTTDLDWESLYVAAIVHDKIMNGCSHTALAALTGELRKREGMFGASVEDRIRLGLGSPRRTKEAIQDSEIKTAVEDVVDYATRLGNQPIIDP